MSAAASGADAGPEYVAAETLEQFELFLTRSHHMFPQHEVMPQMALYLVQRIGTAIHRRGERIAAMHDVHVTDLYILMLLQRAGPDVLTPLATLQKALSFTSGGMTRRLDRLTEQGLVERVTNEQDRRAWMVRLTPAGLARAQAIRDSARKELTDPYIALNREEWGKMVDQLTRIHRIVTSPQPAAAGADDLAGSN